MSDSEIVKATTTKVLYLDDNHNIVPQDKARWLVTHGYNDKGELIFEEWEEIENIS